MRLQIIAKNPSVGECNNMAACEAFRLERIFLPHIHSCSYCYRSSLNTRARGSDTFQPTRRRHISPPAIARLIMFDPPNTVSDWCYVAVTASASWRLQSYTRGQNRGAIQSSLTGAPIVASASLHSDIIQLQTSFSNLVFSCQQDGAAGRHVQCGGR